MSSRGSFLGSAKIIALWTLLSRVTGLGRDMLLNAVLGQTWVQDAFNFGFLIPNLFRRLFGEGALSAVFVPMFTDTLHREGRPAAWALLGKTIARMLAVLVALTVVIELVLLAIWFAQPEESKHRLVVSLTAIMLPFMISICVVAVLSSILNCLGRFSLPAAMPIVLNLCMIAVLATQSWVLNPESRTYVLAASVLVAGVLQLVVIWPALRAEGVRMPLDLRSHDPAIRAMLVALLPVMFGQGVLLVNSFLDGWICTLLTRGPNQGPTAAILGWSFTYPLEQGAYSAMNNAQRLYQFPLGVLAISLATAALPAFSRSAVAGDIDGLREGLARALRLAIFEGLPCGLMLVVLAEPIIQLLFEYGHYTHDHTLRAAHVLRGYGVGVFAFSAQHVIMRGFYSLKDTMTPMRVGVWLVGLNLLLSATLLWHPGIREAAFGISTSLTAILNIGLSLCLLRRKLAERIEGRQIAAGLLRTLIAALAAMAVAWLLRDPAAHWAADLPRIPRRLAEVFLPLSAAAVVYLLAAAALRMEEVGWLLPGRRGRIA